MDRLSLQVAGALWTALGAAKLLSPGELSAYVSSLVGQGIGEALAWALILAEVLLGLTLLSSGPNTRRGLIAGWVSAATALCAACYILVVDHEAQCGCLGALGAQVTEGRRLILAGSIMMLSLIGVRQFRATSHPLAKTMGRVATGERQT